MLDFDTRSLIDNTEVGQREEGRLSHFHETILLMDSISSCTPLRHTLKKFH